MDRAPAPPTEPDQEYQHASLTCDLVMKGGITSGVTYPEAVCEIARTYKVRNVGGTSAGAMAAAAAAAAEAGRDVPGAGFGRLERLPGRLSADSPAGGGSVMFNLFQPAESTRPLFEILSAGLRGKGSRWRQGRYIAWAVVRGAPVAALAGSALGVVALALAIAGLATSDADGIATAALWFGAVTGLLVALLGTAVAAVVSLGMRGAREMPRNGFGMCSGFAPGEPCTPGTPGGDDLQVGPDGRLVAKPLTTWLADELDAMAGKPDPREPLTLGDLAAAGVNLKMFTTNLTDGTPYTMPFRNRMYFFSPDEFRLLFPERVVKWMVDAAPAPRDDDRERAAFEAMRLRNLVPLPDPQDMPVVVMARLSLSFPALLSAIPLWAMRVAEGEGGDQVPQRCWFSDGGITSNFPIHFFDGPLPRWPTFGINLGPGEDLDPTDQRKNIWSPLSNEQGITPRWRAIEGVTGFGHAILDTMQNWMDNAQTRVPGYRDRIVVIKHTKAEGGMNLNMDAELIRRFSERGRRAGEFLVNRFTHEPSTNPDDELSWSNHRWLRYRSVMPLVEELLTGIVKGYDWPPEPESQERYGRMIDASPEQIASFAWVSLDQRDRAVDLTGGLLGLARGWADVPEPVGPVERGLPPVVLSLSPTDDPWEPNRPFAAGAPRPRPVLRIVRDF